MTIGAVVMVLLGRVIMRSSKLRMRVWKIRISSTMPSWPATTTWSPSRIGRSTISITPEAMLDSESFSARPTARPAAPSTANSEVGGTPIFCSAVTNTSTSSNA